MATRLLKNRIPTNSDTTTHLQEKQGSLLSSLSRSSTNQELHTYLHNTISTNITYYKALARYQEKRSRIPRYTNGRQHKNLRLFYRLTESGLKLLKTQYAKKPKNPI